MVSKPSLRLLQSQAKYKNRHVKSMEQNWDSTEIKPYIYGLLIFNKSAKATQCGKRSLFK